MNIAEGILNAYPKTYEEYVDTKLVGKDGINKLTGRDRNSYLNDLGKKEQFEKELNRRSMQVLASQLQEEGSSFYNAVARFKNEFKELGAMGLAALDGPGGRFTIKELYDEGDGILGYVAPKLNMNKVREMLGGDPTPEQLRYIEDFYNKNSLASQTGLAAALLTEAVPVTGTGKGIAKGVSKVAKNINANEIGAVGNINKLVDDKVSSVNGTSVVRGKNVSNKDLNNVAQIGYGVDWNQLSKAQIDGLLDSRGIGPKIDLETGKINPKWKPTQNNPKYNGTREIDIAYTKELDAAAAYHSGGTKKYSDYLTETQRRDQDVGRNNPTTQAYIRKQFIKDNKFITSAKGKPSNLNAVREATEEKLVRRAEAFYEQHGRYPTETELHFNTFGYTVRDSKGTDLVDHSKVIRNLEKNNTLNLSTADEARVERKLKEGEKFQKGIKQFEDQYDEVADKVSDILNIDRTRVTDFFARGHSLREAYFSRVPVELQEKLLRPNQLLTAGQNSRHIHYENTIIHLFDVKEEAMGYMNQILKGENALNKTQLKSIDDLVETFGVSVKEGASNQQKVQAILKGINKNLDQVDNQMLEEGVFTPMYDPISNKERIFGQSTGSKFDPFDPKRPRSDQTRVPPDIDSQVASPADQREAYRRLSEKVKSIDTKTGLPTATNKYGLPLSKGGEVRKGFATGTRNGALVGDDITGDTIFGNYLTNLNLTMDKRLRDQDNMDRILEAPKSMQRAVAMTLYDEDEAAFLEEIRQMPSSVRAEFKRKILEADEIQKSLAETLRDERPVKFPIRSIPKLLTDNVIFKKLLKDQMMPTIVFKNFLDDLREKQGPENAEKIAPNVSKYINLGPTPETPPEQAYIDGIDEFNRALETGVTNIGFSVMDLILGGVDLVTDSKFELTEKLQKLYDEKGINEPETFLGDMTALLVEFGVPGGLVSKLLTRAQKAMRLNGINTMTRYLDPDLTGSARRAIQFTNLASRVGTGAVVFGTTDFIAGGPNNSLKRMFPDDSTLLPGKPERTDDLTGSELVKANFRNRLRFAADGALIGAGFPLIGPPLLGIVKGTAKLPFKTIPGIDRSLVGGTLQLAGVPIRIAADVLAGKIPYTQKMIPAVGKAVSKTGEKTASAVQATAAFVGKNVFARAALAAQDIVFARDAIYSGINRGTTFARGIPKVFGGEGGGLPAFQEWRKFSVNSSDPLHANLARIDNKLALFRDIGKLTKDAFALSTKSQNFIKAKSRTIDKLYTNLEQITYRLAKKFEEQHKKWGQFDVIQKKYLDDVLDYLKGNKKIENIDPPLRDAALELKEYYRKLMTEFKDLLPDGDKLKTLLTQDIDSQMKRSFAAFTNANFRPGAENVKAARDYIANFIKQDTSLQADAKLAFPNAKSLDEAINSLAELKVADLMHVARYEMEDPIRAFKKIAGKLETAGVKGVVDPLEIFTGQELPKVIRQLMGEEKNLKNSLMQTTGNVIASTQQKQALDRIAKLGLENRWLFNTQKEALDIGKINEAIPVGDIKGAGFLPSDILGLYGSPEIVKQLSGYSIFDSALKYKIYQNLLAFKAMVQGGKTLYSPATQMRNFGSASLFAMNVGHIGGKTSVTQNFKIMLDDIFGSGPGVNQSDLIKFIERKIELGVLDENVVAQELGGVLRDLKGVVGADGKPVISNFNSLTQRVGDSKISQTVQRLYAGGDNVWKAYGHEFYMSELKQFTKSLDDVSNFFRTQVGREWEPMKNGVKKTLAEGIEEMAAHLLRETYPTYSRVPPAIQALRKLPLGNFISFPAEMIRTSLATTASSMKMIGSGNPGLQAMGYRALMGQFTTLYGFNHGAQKLASKMTGIGEDKLRAYQDDLGPSYIDDHILIPITKQREDGTFKVFDASTYNPYNYLVGPVEEFIRQLSSTRLDPAQVDSELDRRFFDTVGPFMKLVEPFIGETIALEPILDIYARNGISRDGRQIFSPSDSPSDKREKSIYHVFETIAPGFVRSATQIYGALQLDTKAGRVMELGDVLIRLMGGSIMEVDPVTALDYKAIDIREIRGAAFKTEHFFSKDNALSRGPILDEKGRQVGHVMANELREIQEEAFVAQFGIWKMFHKSLASGLLTEDQIKKVLGKKGRNVPNLKQLLRGEFVPVSFSKDGLKKRANDLVEEYGARGIDVKYEDLYPYYDLLEVINEFKYRRFEDFLDPARPPLDEIPFDIDSISQGPTPPTSDIPVAPLDTSDFADTQIVAAPKQTVVGANNQQVNNLTGLTRNEEALLSPSDQFYRRNQRGKV